MILINFNNYAEFKTFILFYHANPANTFLYNMSIPLAHLPYD